MSDRSPITTHVLDTALGRPAERVPVTLTRVGDDSPLAQGETNADGRVEDLMSPGALEPGDYRLRFDTAAYFQRQRLATFYPAATIEFTVANANEHYHVPLLLSPFGYSTYRGS